MSEEKRKTAAEIREELKACEALIASLRSERDKCEKRIGEIREELHNLTGEHAYRPYGTVHRLRAALASAERWEADQSALVVRLDPPERYGSRAGVPVVLVKVTAKRIYTRYMGEDGEEFWQLDGTSESRWNRQRIHPDDLPKIFEHEVRG
jgi:hypothetical protein